MNYFEIQRRLNRQTRYLYFLFILMIFVAIFIVNIVFSSFDVAMVKGSYTIVKSEYFRWFSPVSITLASMITIIILANFINTRLTATSGAKIAQDLGGTDVTGRTDTLYFCILNQTVDEMAIASGIPAPRIFLLEQDQGINAFAAGFSTADAAIAVTEGALRRLTRPELQALIAHEMSHVVNQDMRVNMHLIAVLSGFMALTSLGFNLIRIITHTRSNDKKDGRVILLVIGFGVLLIVFGFFLYFLGRIIQSKISFRREYFADSHAISSLRQARPMMSLLSKLERSSSISSHVSRLQEEQSLSKIRAEHQHFLFNSSANYFMFKTHPPLRKRIQAVAPLVNEAELQVKYDEKTIEERVTEQLAANKSHQASPDDNAAKSDPLSTIVKIGALAALAANSTDPKNSAQEPSSLVANSESVSNKNRTTLLTANQILEQLPENLKAYMLDKETVKYVYYAFFLADDEQLRTIQTPIFNHADFERIIDVKELIDKNPTDHAYVIAELTFPIFNQLMISERQAVIQTLEKMMNSIGVTLRQYCLYFSLKKMNGLSNQAPPLFLKQKKSATLLSALEAVYYLFSIVAQKASNYADITIRDNHFMQAIHTFYPQSKRKMLILDDAWLASLNNALTELDQLNAKEKTRLIEGLLEFIQMDGKITDSEYELVRFISLCIDYPLPLQLVNS